MNERHDRRVLILAPTLKDAEITAELLGGAEIESDTFSNLDALVGAAREGAAAILVPEEALAGGSKAPLAALLAQQPPWSDLPILILTRPGADSPEAAEAWRTLGNVTLIERPTRVSTLLSAAQTAIRARARQYQIRGHLADRANAERSLRAADRRKDEFLATLGHELRNPLAPILNSVQLLKLTGASGIHAHACDMIERQVHHLNRLVDDLLEVSRVTRGVVEVRLKPIDLADIVRTAIETSRPAIDGAGHELTVDITDDALCVAGDAVRLTQVFANLLNNAAKYTNNGGALAITVSREGEDAVVSVRDNGIGIDEEHLASVFDMFMQVDRSARRAQGGLGIGLTLVRSLVASHGGTVIARSEGEGKGSEFVVRLPLLPAAPERGRTASPVARLEHRRILIVDDSQDGAESLTLLLRALGGEVHAVHDGRAALAAVEAFHPDVILLDVGMPGMDGYEVARRIRADARHRDLPLIALTGWGQDEDRQRSAAAGFTHHLVKPPDIEKLRQLLDVA
jgi:signal transduction histidine kinase/CheY-like chemotaxis protein